MDARQRAYLELHQRFEFLWTAQRYRDALPVAEAELATAEALGDRHPAKVRALLDLGMAALANQDEARGRGLEIDAHRLLTELEGLAERHPNDPATATLWLFQAEREWDLHGDYDRAAELVRRALALRQARFGEESSEAAEAWARLGELDYLKGDWPAAAPSFEAALAQWDQCGDTDHVLYAKALESLAHTRVALENWTAALPLYEKALAWAKAHERQPRSLYYILNGYAQALRAQNRPEEATRAEAEAAQLLPKANPGEFGFHV